MYVLSGHESKVYELIRTGIQPSDIAKLPEYRKASSLYTIVQRLTILGFLEKTPLENRLKHYKPLVTEYEIIDNKRARSRKRHDIKPIKPTIHEPYGHIIVTHNQQLRIFELCIKGNKTSVISSVLGLPRYIVNREIINLGIEQI